MQRSGRRVSITAQLLDPGSGDQLWTNRYERDLEDVLTLRNEIVSAIVREIRAQLSAGEQARLASKSRVNPEAFEAYLKGRFHWLRQTREDYDQAERYFQFALEKDPTYALAYAGLGSVWMMRGDAGFRPPSETVPIARITWPRRWHSTTAWPTCTCCWEIRRPLNGTGRGAEREYREALAANPNLADAHFFYADLLLTALNRPDDWNREMQRALELDPLNDFNRSYYGWHLNYLRRYGEAIPVFEQLLPTGPNKAANYLGLWGAYFRTGRYGDALRSARDYFEAAGDGEFATALGTGRDRADYRAAMIRTGEADGRAQRNTACAGDPHRQDVRACGRHRSSDDVAGARLREPRVDARAPGRLLGLGRPEIRPAVPEPAGALEFPAFRSEIIAGRTTRRRRRRTDRW